MEIRFLVPDLRALDGLTVEALALPIFEDERPLRGAAGLCDWRLNGRLSKLLLRGRVRGVRGEHVLVPGRPRLPIDKIFLFGLGPRASFGEDAARAAIAEVLEVLDGVRARTAAFVLPGRSLELLPPDRAIEILLEAGADRVVHDEMVLVDHLDAHRAMVPVLERAQRRARAQEA